MPGFRTIQKNIALFLLVVFALSATPKAFFHDLLTHHKDGLVCTNHDPGKPCLHRQAYHCAFDDLVVTAPYLAEAPAFALNERSFAPAHNEFLLPTFFAAFTRHTGSRGPPRMH